MKYVKKMFRLIDNYIIARIQNRPSTALFWYLPEPVNLNSAADLSAYQEASASFPLYLIDYRSKLKYTLENAQGIIVLPYDKPIGSQINPEAAFQYALGLHDQFCTTNNPHYLNKFFKYVDYFMHQQTADGMWNYNFDWYATKAPWNSALAQARGASVMLRAWLHSKDDKYKEASKKALAKFLLPISQGGFLHIFPQANCPYFEEYPHMPTAVINGFMAALISIWEVNYWMKEPWLAELWQIGLASLIKMLPYYSTGWWSLYDLDKQTPVPNVNSPRYHCLEIHYLKVLSILAVSPILTQEYEKRSLQYRNPWFRTKALGLKVIRKILYK